MAGVRQCLGGWCFCINCSATHATSHANWLAIWWSRCSGKFVWLFTVRGRCWAPLDKLQSQVEQISGRQKSKAKGLHQSVGALSELGGETWSFEVVLFHIRVLWSLMCHVHCYTACTYMYVSIWPCYFNDINAIILSSSINGCGRRRAFVAGLYEMFTSWQNVAFLLCFTEMNTNPTVDHWVILVCYWHNNFPAWTSLHTKRELTKRACCSL